MSDDNFIPLNQSTPNQNRQHDRRQHRNRRNQQPRYFNPQQNERSRSGYNQWRNNTRINGQINNSRHNSVNDYVLDDYEIDAMLRDPWEELRQEMEEQLRRTNPMNVQNATLDRTTT